ncbi:MAG: metal-dependent hydrolase, beta-lactamase superfamily [Acidimicrobiales bacterium]|nr:metal-dependent hydrolase, beta-lactamase superfamily [Acidimicrobiales bacterium]
MAPDLMRHLTKDRHLTRERPPLTITVLGSAGTFPHKDNPCSGYLVRTPTTTVWIDTGPGTFAALQEHVELAEIDAIVVSHEHPDHWVELPVIRNAALYMLGIEHLPVYGTAGTRALAEHVIGGPTEPPMPWTTVTDGSEVTIGDLAFRFSRTDHPVETLAMRIEAGGRVLAYSADTGSAWSFTALDPGGTGFDLALCEATFAPEEADRFAHLTAAQAGAMAAAAKVQRLALTHLTAGAAPDRELEAAAPDAFDGPVEIAGPGYTFTV